MCNESSIDSLTDDNGKPKWISSDDINTVFCLAKQEATRGALAWYLSQPTGAEHYHGQWFEKSGFYVREKDSGEIAMTTKGLPRFKTKFYRITEEGLQVIRYLMSKGINDAN